MTPNREDYLKAIYASNLAQIKITNKIISEELKISPPSVSEMISKLIESNQVKKDEYLGYVLTKEGALEAQKLMRKHRLWEVFLVDYLGYSWDDVHADAEVLEHATSDSLADRLNIFLKQPKYCPHGSVIFGNVTETAEKRIPLYQLERGDLAIIREVNDNRKFLEYLVAKDLKINLEFEVADISEFDRSYTLKVAGRDVLVSELASKEIFVEKVSQ